jgi:hypothetical protein
MSYGHGTIKAQLEEQLKWMASHAVSSNKEQVKDILVNSLLMTFSKKGIVFVYGDGSITRAQLISTIKETNLYKWVEIVETATSMEDVITLIQDQYKKDPPFVSKTLIKTWGEVSSLFNVQWKFKFNVPKEQLCLPLKRRKAKANKKIIPLPVFKEPEKNWLENIPEDSRHIVQMLSEEGSTPFQRTIIKTILSNRFDEGIVTGITMQFVATNGHKYEMSIKKN